MRELKTFVVISIYFPFVFIYSIISTVHEKTYYLEGLFELSLQNRLFLFGNLLPLETDDLLDP